MQAFEKTEIKLSPTFGYYIFVLGIFFAIDLALFCNSWKGKNIWPICPNITASVKHASMIPPAC